MQNQSNSLITFDTQLKTALVKMSSITSNAVCKLKRVRVARVLQQKNTKVGDIHHFMGIFLKLQQQYKHKTYVNSDSAER